MGVEENKTIVPGFIENMSRQRRGGIRRASRFQRSKGWRDHPPYWSYNYHGLFKLHRLPVARTGMAALSRRNAFGRRQLESRVRKNCVHGLTRGR